MLAMYVSDYVTIYLYTNLFVVATPKKWTRKYVDSCWSSARSKSVSEIKCSSCSPSKYLPLYGLYGLYVFTFRKSEPQESRCMSCQGLRIIKARHMHLASGQSIGHVRTLCRSSKSNRMIEDWAWNLSRTKYMNWLKWYWNDIEMILKWYWNVWWVMVSLRVSSAHYVFWPVPHLASSKQCGSPRWRRPCRWSIQRKNEAISLDNIWQYNDNIIDDMNYATVASIDLQSHQIPWWARLS